MIVAIPWLLLAACVSIIAFAGPVLVTSSKEIARQTGWSLGWVGVVLLATATSLPELATGVSAVRLADAPDIAVADVLGSCVINLLLLVLLDEFGRRPAGFGTVDQGHLLTAGFGIILIGGVGGILLLSSMGLNADVFHISLASPILAALYFAAVRSSFTYHLRRDGAAVKADDASARGLRRQIIRYALAGAAVVGAGIGLPFVGLAIADTMGWQTTFVGTLFIAGATSVPELVVTISAIRQRAVDMAIGGLLGSNLFDIFVLAIDDLLYVEGSLFRAASPTHAVTALAAMIMSGIFIIAVLVRPGSPASGRINGISLSLLIVYLLSAYASFALEGQI